MKWPKNRAPFLVIALSSVLFAGCGGGGGDLALTGGGGGNGGGGGGPVADQTGTAKFSVDLKTGRVNITELRTTDPRALAVFSGAKIGFVSSTVIDQPGDTGRKAINVSLVNNSGEPIGQMTDGPISGVRVIFNAISTVLSGDDLRARTNVSTFAGGAMGSDDGPISSATFKNPVGIARASNGDFYVTDAGNNKIRKISQGQVVTLAGSGAIGTTDGAGPTATFNVPLGIAVLPDGDLVVSDSLGHKIRRITPAGVVTTIAGTGAAGGTNGQGNAALFNRPQGVAVSSNGVIYVAEQLGHRIRKITLTGPDKRVAADYTVTTFAGTGVAGSANGLGTAASFNEPRGVAIDGSGNVYVADTNNHRIRRINTTAEVVTIGGTGVVGAVDRAGTTATFSSPFGIAMVGNSVVVADLSGRRLRQLSLVPAGNPNNAASWLVKAIAGNGNAGLVNGGGATAEFQTPYLIAFDGVNGLYVCDYGNNKIRKISSIGSNFPIPVSTTPGSSDLVQLANATGRVGGNGMRPYVEYAESLAPNGSTSSKPWVFSVPSGVTAFEFIVTVEAKTDYLSGLEAAEGVASAKNMVSTFTGGKLGEFVDGAPSQARFTALIGITIDRAGNLYGADSGNHAIRRVSSGGITSTVAGTGSPGSVDGPGNTASFNSPRGVSVSADGKTLYVTDTSNETVRIIILTGNDPARSADWQVSTIAGGVGDVNYVNGTGDLARFSKPFGIAAAEGGNVYVSELEGNRIRALRYRGGDPTVATNWHVQNVAGSTVAPNGIAGATDGFGSSARFAFPEQIAVDSAGTIYVADYNNNRIRKVTDLGDVTTLAGSTFGYLDGQGSGAMFGSPMSVAVDSAGYVYVGDSNHNIRRISPSGVVRTVAGSTISASGDIDGLGPNATFYYPQGLACDRSGSLYVVSGGQYPFEGGGSVTSPGLRIRKVERIIE